MPAMQCPQQPFGWNRRPPAVDVEPGELAIEHGQHIIDDVPDHSQRMLRRDTTRDTPAAPHWRERPNHIRFRVPVGGTPVRTAQTIPTGPQKFATILSDMTQFATIFSEMTQPLAQPWTVMNCVCCRGRWRA
jgi:hypothetical protein